jgi:hypothetical protein
LPVISTMARRLNSSDCWLADHLVSRFGIKCGLRWVAIGAPLVSILGSAAALNLAETNSLVAPLARHFRAPVTDVVFWAAVISVAGPQAGAAGGLMNTGGNRGGTNRPVPHASDRKAITMVRWTLRRCGHRFDRHRLVVANRSVARASDERALML